MVERAGDEHGDLGPQSTGGDEGRHGVRGVVKPVGEVEHQRGHDDHDDGHPRSHGLPFRTDNSETATRRS